MKTKIGILGATGMVGQRLVSLLENHPYFEVEILAGSSKSAGLKYEDAVKDRWKIDKELPKYVKQMIVDNVMDIKHIASKVKLVICALDMDKESLAELETDYAKEEVIVVSNNSAHRWTKDVPIIIPEINSHHLDIISFQKQRLNTKKGFIVAKPNCSIQSYVPVLNALREFGPEKVIVSTYQAISGSGKNFEQFPEIIGNIIPHIEGEEEKSEQEPLKVWGEIKAGEFVKSELPLISAKCIRVPVLDGHLASVVVKFKKKPSYEEIVDKLKNYKTQIQDLNLPSAPKDFITFTEIKDRPQPLLDKNAENGMGIVIGNLKEDKVFDYSFVGLSHNTIRGAAGGALLLAELIYAKGYLL